MPIRLNAVFAANTDLEVTLHRASFGYSVLHKETHARLVDAFKRIAFVDILLDVCRKAPARVRPTTATPIGKLRDG